MDGRWLLVAVFHGVATALALQVLGFLLPEGVVSYYANMANLLLCLFVAKATLPLSKKKFLSDRVQPENKAVFITGCDTGFGHQLAKRLDSEGFHVFASCLDPTSEGAASLRTSCSERLHVCGLDVTKDDSVGEALAFVKENLGALEFWALVNNAGILHGASTELTSMAQFRGNLEVNALGMVRVTKAFLPMLRKHRGRVVNLASICGRLSIAHVTAYTMSKAAAVAFTECLKQEMDVWGVKVISVEPEIFRTRLTDSSVLIQTYENSLEHLADDVKADYGADYLEDFKGGLGFAASFGSTKLHRVVDALAAAVSLRHPDAVVKPCRNIRVRLLVFLLESWPVVMTDLLARMFTLVTRFPTPKEAGNKLFW